jgi:hypothetical protein
MGSPRELRALAMVSRRDLEQAASALRAAREEADHLEVKWQVAKERLELERRREQESRTAEHEHLEREGSLAADRAHADALRVRIRGRIERSQEELASSAAGLTVARATVHECRLTAERLLERCVGLDDRIRAELRAELLQREDLADEERSSSGDASMRRRLA